jgi:integrase
MPHKKGTFSKGVKKCLKKYDQIKLGPGSRQVPFPGRNEQAAGYPYVFVPPARYDHIQELRHQGKWNAREKLCPVSNFRRQFRLILSYAGIEHGQFHYLRRTCLTNWFAHGLSEFDIMTMAGHSSFETTRRFYLAIRSDLLDRARSASARAMSRISVANPLQIPFSGSNKKGCQT